MNFHGHTVNVSGRLTPQMAYDLAYDASINSLMRAAAKRRDEAHGNIISFSKKVFIPLTHLCRDVCHYCTFAKPPKKGAPAFMQPDEVLAVARKGREAGCHEALFTLGDKPELRYRAAREELAALGHDTTLSYLARMADLVFKETGLLPHLNPGLLTTEDMRQLRDVSVSQGIMLETISDRLSEKGRAHYGSPDKVPAKRLATIQRAGELGVPFTSGILIGIGETRQERLDALFALRDMHDQFGHIQEIIIQNFLPKPDTRMATTQAPDVDEQLWTVAMARLIFDPEMNIQSPPNLRPDNHQDLIDAGINDWGGVSPVTPDFVNPEAPWPNIAALSDATQKCGKTLVERLAIYPSYVRQSSRWTTMNFQKELLKIVDTDGWPRESNWHVGKNNQPPSKVIDDIYKPTLLNAPLRPLLLQAEKGKRLNEDDIVRLFRARGRDFNSICRAADEIRSAVVGDIVSYVVTRNINYTNICYFKCNFCAFSKGKTTEQLRGKPYDLRHEEIAERVKEAWRRGATEVCMQGGIHPDYTGQKYLDVCRLAKEAVPQIHIHAFSPLEIHQGAKTLGISIDEFLAALKQSGLNSLPGTAAEILDDEVRAVLCPDKIKTNEWIEVMRSAHMAGLRSTATIMFGHIERYEHWARHLLRVRDLQSDTGGFTEFVPLPFVHMESPIGIKGQSRLGPTYREVTLMHAIARLVLNPLISNIQASWVKLGVDGVAPMLDAGVNDLGGTLMDESISRAAGASHGQEMTPQLMEQIIAGRQRQAKQRTTFYGEAPADQKVKSYNPQ